MADIYWPFSTDLVSEWPGERGPGWGYHVGTDFKVPQGTPLLATMSGTVDIHWDDGLGAWVIDIISPDGTVVRNGHMSHMEPRDGDWVNAGDYIGNTGGGANTPGAGLSTGPHLHWEIRSNRNWTGPGWYDPRDLTILTFDKDTEGEDDMFTEADRGALIETRNNARKTVTAVAKILALVEKGGTLSTSDREALIETRNNARKTVNMLAGKK